MIASTLDGGLPRTWSKGSLFYGKMRVKGSFSSLASIFLILAYLQGNASSVQMITLIRMETYLLLHLFLLKGLFLIILA
jgi:hypothetical protein